MASTNIIYTDVIQLQPSIVMSRYVCIYLTLYSYMYSIAIHLSPMQSPQLHQMWSINLPVLREMQQKLEYA